MARPKPVPPVLLLRLASTRFVRGIVPMGLPAISIPCGKTSAGLPIGLQIVGRHRDDWGNWFGNANYTWLWQYNFPSRYLKRNPNLAVRDMRTMLAQYPDAGRVYPLSSPLQRPNAVGAENHVTSANSAMPKSVLSLAMN